jgi:uncharacterized coiled-coil protein SlyX
MATPTAQKADYFFCRNTKCSFHAMFLLKDKPADMVQGSPCPVCKEGKLEIVELETTAPVAPSTGDAIPTGIVLPVPPYGGFTLTFGDSDESQTWEQVTGHPEPQHQNARYVAELQRDLMRLGFYSHGREAAADKAGEFTLSVLSGVLDLKRHLSDYYGFMTSEDMETVKKATEAGGDAPIYYRPMKNPSIAFNRTHQWSSGLTTARRGLDEWAKLWEASMSSGKAGSESELDTLEAQRVQLATDLAALKAKRKAAKTAADNATTVTIPSIRRKIQSLKIGLSTAADPEAAKQEIANLEEKLKEIQKQIGEINAEIIREKQEIDKLEQRLNALPNKISTARKKIKKRDDAYTALLQLIGHIEVESSDATLLIHQLAHRPASHFNVKLTGPQNNYQNDRANAIALMKKLLKEDADVKKAGAAIALPLRAAEIQAAWDKKNVPRPESWKALRDNLDAIKITFELYQKEANDPATEGTKLFDGYRQELREFGKVDPATARIIRQMVWTGQLAGRAVFWLPMDDEIEQLDAKGVDETIRVLVDDLKTPTTVNGKTVIRDRNNSPIEILHFIFVHESGAKHTMKFGGREYVTIGIDWQNGKGEDKSIFKEQLTDPTRWSASRGWGLTQKTFFDAPMKMRDRNGKIREYEMHAGIPYVANGDMVRPNPDPIASAKANMAAGVGLYLQNFNVSKARRDCTFKEPYNCSKCVKNFNLTPQGTRNDKGKFTPTRKDSSILFDDAKTDFERVTDEKLGAIAYRMNKAERMKELVAKGEYTAPGGNGTDFPCSWITAVIRYAGSGNQAYLYGLEAMWTMAGKPAPVN